MAETTQSDLNSAGTVAYEQLAYFPLRDALFFDPCADVKPTRQSHRGSTVTFNIYNDVAPAVTPLSETADVTPVTVTDNTVTVVVDEYGNVATTTALARGTSYLVVSEDVANVIGYNAGLSLDCLARNPLLDGTNMRFTDPAHSTRSDIAAGDVLTASDIRGIFTELQDTNVQAISGGFYVSFISPRVVYDIREETGQANWREPHLYTRSQTEIWNGEIGEFEGFRYIVTPRLTPRNLETAQGGPGGFVDAGAGATVDVYQTLFLGRQALAKTFASMVSNPIPSIRLGAVVDTLGRFVPVGWYWLGGYGRFREEALWRVESASSVQQ